MDLQLFSEEILPQDDTTPEDNLVVHDDDLDVEGDELPEGEEEELPDGAADGEDDELPDEEAEPQDQKAPEDGAKPYTQAELDKIIQTRLDRARRSWEREFMQAAGMPIQPNEIQEAAALWGFLSRNPQIGQQVSALIQSAFDPNAPNPYAAQIRDLELREAAADLRADDEVFRKHEQDILAWVQSQRIPINSGRDIQLAYLAWKGQNYRVDAATAELTAQRKLQQNTMKKRQTTTVKTKPTKTAKPIDYQKMSAEQILKAEGLNLFVPEDY